MLKNVTIIWNYNNKQLFNSYIQKISYITYSTLAPSLRALRNYMTISKVRLIQKRLELQIKATAFWNLKTKRNLLIFKTKLQAIFFCHNSVLKFGNFLALAFGQNVTNTFINQKRFGLQINVAPFWNLKNQSNMLVFETKLQVIQFCHN